MPKTEHIKGGDAPVDMDFRPIDDMDPMAEAGTTHWQQIADNLAKENEELRMDLAHSQELCRLTKDARATADKLRAVTEQQLEQATHSANQWQGQADDNMKSAMFWKGVAVGIDPVKATAADAARKGGEKRQMTTGDLVSRIMYGGDAYGER